MPSPSRKTRFLSSQGFKHAGADNPIGIELISAEALEKACLVGRPVHYEAQPQWAQ
jgi:hypothetical protein